METRFRALDLVPTIVAKWPRITPLAIAIVASIPFQNAFAEDGFDLPTDPVVTLPAESVAPPPVVAAPPPVTTAQPPPTADPAPPKVEAAATTTTAGSEKSTTVQPANTEEGFTARTAALEEQVNNLSQMVQGTKFRLLALSEEILGSGATSSGAKLSVWHRNELGSSYVITSIVYVLDGTPIYVKSDETGALGARDEFVLFDSRILPGPHQLTVQYDLRGHGFGVFSYLEELKLTLRKSLSFNVEPRKVTRITGAAFEKGNITVEFKDRPDINFEQTVTKEVLKPHTETPESGAEPSPSVAGAEK